MEDLKEGKGVYVIKGNSRYEGEFREGFKHGDGKEHFYEGSVYIGQYEKGKMHGNGNNITVYIVTNIL